MTDQIALHSWIFQTCHLVANSACSVLLMHHVKLCHFIRRSLVSYISNVINRALCRIFSVQNKSVYVNAAVSVGLYVRPISLL